MSEIEINIKSRSGAGLRQVPTLSLKEFTDGTAYQQRDFIHALFYGIKDYGFIVLKDHDVPHALFHEAYQLMEQFFKLPVETKMQYAGVEGGARGYTAFGKEHAKDSPVMDLKEFWHVGREAPGHHPLAQYHPPNVWPKELPQFQPILGKIYDSLERAGRTLLQALTFPLDVPATFFDDMVLDGSSILRLLHYPPIPAGVDPRCIRAAAHEDINLITILPAATAAGLQLKDRNGEWLDVNAEADSLIVDSGDMLSRITNEVVPSTTHRVINTPEATHVSRYSMPFFMHPNPQALLSCLPSCRGDGAKYADITAHDFLMQRLREIGLK